jgi:tagaturonate epimerase
MKTNLTSSNLHILPRSLAITQQAEFGLTLTDFELKLAVLAQPGSKVIEQFEGEISDLGSQTLLLGTLNHNNAKALRTHLTWLQPKLIGLKTSAGMGDRLGIATPGHVRAVRNFEGRIAPIFAQQSIREMKRTGRCPDEVMDDAMWGCFEEGWQAGAGCDADHLKTYADIDACFAAGFTFYTFDPGEYVDGQSQNASPSQITELLLNLPKEILPDATGLLGKSFNIEGLIVSFDQEVLHAAVLKYGRAVAHVAGMYAYLDKVAGDHPFEVEVSMDETEHPTSPAEHVYIASELHRLGVKWVSFAPRFVGRFEKGVDYIGNIQAIKDNLAVHAAIARRFGPYKLSLHSGSDKFSIYSIFMEATQGLSHLKTAGTSYLEALRTIAAIEPELLEEIYCFARDHFETDRLSYHTSAQINRAPSPVGISDWPSLLDQFDAREILHVTFGSVLTDKNDDGLLRFYDDIMSLLRANREAYFENLEQHFKRHLAPFSIMGSE